MKDKAACSYDFLERMRDGKYYEAVQCAEAMLEVFGDVLRHHEMMLTVCLRRENITAALEHCDELISYGRLKGVDVAEYETNREALLVRIARTRNYMAARFWDEVTESPATAGRRYAAVPLVLAGEAHCQENEETGGVFFVFHIRGQADKRIACRLAPYETPFLEGMAFPHWVAVHGWFLNASETLILLDPCHCISVFDTPPQ